MVLRSIVWLCDLCLEGEEISSKIHQILSSHKSWITFIVVKARQQQSLYRTVLLARTICRRKKKISWLFPPFEKFIIGLSWREDLEHMRSGAAWYKELPYTLITPLTCAVGGIINSEEDHPPFFRPGRRKKGVFHSFFQSLEEKEH